MLSDCTYLRIPLYAGAFSIFPYCMSPISPKRNNGEEVYPGWRFIMLDSYDISMCGSSSIENKIMATKILEKNNPSALKMGGELVQGSTEGKI